VSSSYVERKPLLPWVFLNSSASEGSPAPAAPTWAGVAHGEVRSVRGESRSGLSRVLAWLSVTALPKAMPGRQTGTARHCAGSRCCSQGQDNAARPVCSSGTGHLPLPAPGPCCSKLSPCPLDDASLPSSPKVAKVTCVEFQAPRKFCLLQTSQGEQTGESQSVLSQLMQLIRIILNSESK